MSINVNTFADSKIKIIKEKIQETESKMLNKIWGEKDCSQHSTKTFKGLADYKRCKNNLEPSDKSIFKVLSWKKKKKEFDPNKPCNEYSTKTFTGLAAKLKCKRAKKN